MVDFKENEQLNTLNHSCAHVMAQAIKHLYPQAKFWVGPVVAEGFYYDVDLGDEVVSDEAIAKIEKEMKKICKDGKRIVRREISKEEALEMFKDDEYKLDLISNLKDGTITCYSQGDFTDLCRGPHVETVKMCKNFKLIKHSGAYWKGDKNNKVLQRIYGVCFPTAEELEEHLSLLEEAKDIGIGIYWIAGALVRSVQQVIINRHMSSIDMDEVIRKNQEKAAKKREKAGLPPQKITQAATQSVRNIQVQENEEPSAEEKEAARKASTEYYNSNQEYRAGSIAAKANMVKQFDEKNTKKK